MSRRINRVFQLRMTEKEREDAHRIAAQNKMTLADLIRHKIFEQPIKTVQSVRDLAELRRQGELLKRALNDKRTSEFEPIIRKHLQLFRQALELWIEHNDPKNRTEA